MAFASMFLVFMLVVIIILAATFLLGFVLFLVGIANTGKVKKDKKGKKKWPYVLSVLGVLTMIPPVIITVVVTILAFKYNYDIEHMLDKYGSVTEAWQNVSVMDEKAGNQALEVLFAAADAHDRNKFMEQFSEQTRNDPDFISAVDKFFEDYPGDFSEKEFTYHGHGGQTSFSNSRGGKREYECDVDGVHYYVTVGYVYQSEEHPEMVGIYFLTIMNVEGQAMSTYGDTDINKSNNDMLLMCYLPSSDEVSARRIDGYAYLWNPSDRPAMTKEEMRACLSQYETLQDAIDAGAIGQPNVIPLKDGFDLGNYFYELKSEDGEPRYANVKTIGAFGKIDSAYECTDTDSDYDDPIIKHVNKN